MAKISVVDIKGSEASTVDLPDAIFKEKINTDVIHQAIVMYQASLRQGNASTKERADKSGGGKKPYRQKGTGRARAGSTRSPLWKGGGVTFGPHPRDFSYSLPKKIRKLALSEALNAKYKDNNIICVEELKGEFKKTKEFAKIILDLKLEGRILAVLDGADDSVMRVTNNIARFSLVRSQDVNAYDILRNKNLLLTKEALDNILKRIQK